MELGELIFGFLNGEVTAIDFRSSLFFLASVGGKDEKDVFSAILEALADWLDEDVCLPADQLIKLKFRIQKGLGRIIDSTEIPPT